MTNLEITLTPEARALLDDHLERVALALKSSQMGRDERLSICDDVETHILAMLTKRGQDEISADVMREVLTTVDAPESFDTAVVQNGAPMVRDGASTRAASLAALVSFVVGTTLIAWFAIEPSEQFLWLGTPVLIVTALVSGWLSFRARYWAPQRRFTTLHRWLALFGIVYVPLLMLFAVPQIVIEPILDAFTPPGPRNLFNGSALTTLRMLSMLLAILGAAAVSVLASKANCQQRRHA